MNTSSFEEMSKGKVNQGHVKVSTYYILSTKKDKPVQIKIKALKDCQTWPFQQGKDLYAEIIMGEDEYPILLLSEDKSKSLIVSSQGDTWNLSLSSEQAELFNINKKVSYRDVSFIVSENGEVIINLKDLLESKRSGMVLRKIRSLVKNKGRRESILSVIKRSRERRKIEKKEEISKILSRTKNFKIETVEDAMHILRKDRWFILSLENTDRFLVGNTLMTSEEVIEFAKKILQRKDLPP